MAFIRLHLLTVMFALCMMHGSAQTVYYPAHASQLLISTAEDLVSLLQRADPGSHFSISEYTVLPTQGLVLVYDSSISDNQACRITSNGKDFITFTASQDNGIHFGIYQYLAKLGYRFFQPGSIWEIIPTLTSPYCVIDTVFTSRYQYKSWSISGGHNRWIMDNDASYGWDNYYGANGHEWALYQRRNGMTGGFHFTGHRGDMMNGVYFSELQNNSCYVACYNGSRVANRNSVPDINNSSAMHLWSSTIDDQYRRYKNTIYGNRDLYANYYRNFNYYNGHIGIEPPDGAAWGNSKDNNGCSSAGYPKESDQQFTLANYTVQQLAVSNPGKRFQLYAYASHADLPSPGIVIHDNIDIQVVPTAFQNESSPKGLLNRWYNRSGNISEYQYMNIPQWGGETPMFYLDDLKQTLQRAKEKKSQGIIWEASPAKFASLPFLLAANKNLLDNADVDSTLHQFCNDMFATANTTVYELLQLWSNDRTVSTGNFIQDNKYKIPLYLQLINKAAQQTQSDGEIVKQRIRELKAYAHYMVLYYDWLFDQRSNNARFAKAAGVCIYLAKVNKLQLVNSYFLITDICSRYTSSSNFFSQYNVNNGTAYQNGNLPLINNDEIDRNFEHDLGTTSNQVHQYQLQTAGYIRDHFKAGNLITLEQINVKISYTNGYNYPNHSEFYISAPAAGKFSIQYTPHFNMTGKGYINFIVESCDRALHVVSDFSLDNTSTAGILNIALPASGNYKLSVISKYQSSVDLLITTNGNYFYKNGPFLGNKTENYSNDLLSLPGYFYVPGDISRIYFSINNSNAGGKGFAVPADISKAFEIKDNKGNSVFPQLLNSEDSAFFFLDVPVSSGGSFWQVTRMGQFNLCFANISNLQWFASRIPCSNLKFSVSVNSVKGDCLTRLTTSELSDGLSWEINDEGRWNSYSDLSVIDLPASISSRAVVTLTNKNGCSITKRLGDDQNYQKLKEACSGSAALPRVKKEPVLYPNPSNGVFNCQQQGITLTADEIIVSNTQGSIVGDFASVNLFNISNMASGIYTYRIIVKGQEFTGKLVKQ